MASRLIRNQLPRKGLRVRVPCPPLFIQGLDPSAVLNSDLGRAVSLAPLTVARTAPVPSTVEGKTAALALTRKHLTAEW